MLNNSIPAIGLWRLIEWKLDAPQLVEWTRQVLDLGGRIFDVADVYGDYQVETHFGNALALDKSMREKIYLITKCDICLVSTRRPANRVKHYDTSRTHITSSVENSLRQLHTDRLDLLLIHRTDPLMDADETAEALIALKQSGKVLNVGVSNFSPSLFDLLASRLPFTLTTNQVQFSVLHRDPMYDGTFDHCQRLRMTPMAWSPMGGGALFRDQSPAVIRLRNALEAVGQELGGLAMDQVALAWIVRHPAGIVPVVGTRSIDSIRNAMAATRIKLTRQQWFTVLEAAQGHAVP
jgi:predicted oxidoreductase